MHPSLALGELAARKAELCAEADTLRREFCGQAAKLKPFAHAVQFGFNTIQTLKKSDGAIHSLCGVALDPRSSPPVTSSTPGVWTSLLRGSRLAARAWTLIRAFEGLALRNE